MKRTKLKYGCGHVRTVVAVPPVLQITVLGETAAYQWAADEAKTEAKQRKCERCEGGR